MLEAAALAEAHKAQPLVLVVLAVVVMEVLGPVQ
jgi:hypothetical protein